MRENGVVLAALFFGGLFCYYIKTNETEKVLDFFCNCGMLMDIKKERGGKMINFSCK